MKDFKLEDLEKVGPITVKKLNNAGIYSPLDVVVRGIKEFSRESGLSMDMAERHMKTIKKLLAEDGNDIEIKDIKSLRALRKRRIKVPLKVEELDNMFGGGVETQAVFELYGSEGSGKTQLTMTLAAEALGKGYGVMFIDCEGTFEEERFEEICQSRDITYDEDNLGYHMQMDSAELSTTIKNLVPELVERDVRYIVVDGLVGLFRLSHEGRGELYDRQNEIEAIYKYLRNLSILLNVGIIVSNHVMSNPDPFGAKEKPTGGHVVGHYSKYIISINKGMKNNRVARLIKSPKDATGDFPFFLNEEGVSTFETLAAKNRNKKMDDIQENTQALVDKELLLD